MGRKCVSATCFRNRSYYLSRQCYSQNPSALQLPPTEATGQDAQKAGAVLKAYRGSVGDAKSIKSGDAVTIQFNR
jgi:hypothetical protein